VRVGLALAAGLLAIAIGAALTLARRPRVVVAENLPKTHHKLIAAIDHTSACQAGETLPAGVTAIRLALTADVGARVGLEALAGGRVLTRGSRSPGWEGASVTVPVRPLAQSFAPVEICFALTELNGQVVMLGVPTRHAVAARGEGQALPGRMHIEYLQPGGQSWWSLANSVAWHLGLGRAASGPWNVFLLMALAALLVGLSTWLALRELR
jgi:hypothetical protein